MFVFGRQLALPIRAERGSSQGSEIDGGYLNIWSGFNLRLDADIV